MGDEIDVEGEDLLRRYHGLQQVVGPVGGGLGVDEAQAFGHPVDVGVHGHGRHAQGEAEDHGGGLGPDSR